MYYEKASAEVITFVNGSFIKTFDSDTPAGGADASGEWNDTPPVWG